MTHARPPIVAVVGHIDHGKSALQRALRDTDTEFSEAGDITQHIGAYELRTRYEGSERKATIIDTPGHKAFSHIREHGLDLADIALLVISSEEGWKEQTSEAYAVIQEKSIPYIVVFTKTDTAQSDVERAKQSVLQQSVLLEGLGGEIPWIGVSSVTGDGISDLVELIFLTTDVYEIVENRDDGSVGVLVETDVDPQVGIAGTIIVLDGSLERRGHVRVGGSVAPLRIMEDDRGRSITSASPSAPIRVFGFDSIPPIGDPVFIYTDKKSAVEDAKRHQVRATSQRTKDAPSGGQVIPLVLRSDTASGLVSIQHAVAEAAVAGVTFTVIKQGVGKITEEDVRIALTERGSYVLGFHTSADSRSERLAEHNDISLLLFPTIYEITNWAAEVSAERRDSHALKHPTGTASVIRIFEEQPSQGVYIIGAQTEDGSFFVDQSVASVRDGSPVGRFLIASMEQRHEARSEISGANVQFAMRLRGEGSIASGDMLFALPDPSFDNS